MSVEPAAEKSIDELIHEYHDAWDRGDHEAGWAFYSDDVKVHMGGRGPLSGEYTSKKDFVENWVQRVSDYCDEWLVGYDNTTLMLGNDGVVLMIKETWRKGDKAFFTDRIGIYKFANGKIVECWFSDMDQAGAEEFFGDLS
jgi:ketosteroid isomerase-like protein